MPSTKTVPGGGSLRRGSRFSSVDLPDPVAPTMAVVVPAGSVQETSPRTGRVAVGERQIAEFDVAANLVAARRRCGLHPRR